MSDVKQMIPRGQVCKAFDCKYKATCINMDNLCETLPGCPYVYKASICQCCCYENMCIYKNRG